MNPDDFIELGYVSKAHGMKGELKAVFAVQDLSDFIDIPVFHLSKKGQGIQAYVIEDWKVQTEKQSVIKLEGIDSKPEAEALVGMTILFPEEELPELEEGHFYYFEVIGFQVVDTVLGPLGKIMDFADGAIHDIMIMEFKGHEVLITVADHIVGLADFEKEELSVTLPEGLLEIYMGTDEEE
ncbi:MAG: ribosome maturation factor RimM [Bacteroidia bacterium]|nr:ribosome maturation factor RimM [Bacteroidia bacterium]